MHKIFEPVLEMIIDTQAKLTLLALSNARVFFFHRSPAVHAILTYNTRMGFQKTKQTRSDSAASEDER